MTGKNKTYLRGRILQDETTIDLIVGKVAVCLINFIEGGCKRLTYAEGKTVYLVENYERNKEINDLMKRLGIVEPIQINTLLTDCYGNAPFRGDVCSVTEEGHQLYQGIKVEDGK